MLEKNKYYKSEEKCININVFFLSFLLCVVDK